MEITVRREKGTKKTTPGRMYVNGKMFCYTLEDVERPGVARDPSKKVYGETAIPRGRYQVTVSKSTRFKRDMLLLLNVPQFEGIRVHSGNTAEDTHGCIIVARNRESLDKIYGDSRLLEGSLTTLVKKALASKEKVFITVTHEEEGTVLQIPEISIKA